MVVSRNPADAAGQQVGPVGFVEGPPLSPVATAGGPHWHGRPSKIITVAEAGLDASVPPVVRLVEARFEHAPNRRVNSPPLSWMLSAVSATHRSAIERSCEHCAHAAHGRPRHVDGHGSFSHTRGDGLSALIVHDRFDRIGIDVEPSRMAETLDSDFVAVVATANERAVIDASSSFGRAALELWVSKEAVVKMLGIGIVADLTLVQRVHQPDDAVASVQCFWRSDHCFAIATPVAQT